MTDKERIEDLEDALRGILRWCDAYPTRIFSQISDDEVRRAGEVLEAADISIAALHAQWSRHILQGIGDIIKMILK